MYVATLLETDPVDIKLDTDGDLFVDGDGFHFVYGLEGVAQLVRIAILLFRGEWFLNLDTGMPYFQSFLGEKFDETQMRDEYIKAVMGVQGVLSILSLVIAFDPSTRKVLVTIETRTQFGDTPPDTLAPGVTTHA